MENVINKLKDVGIDEQKFSVMSEEEKKQIILFAMMSLSSKEIEGLRLDGVGGGSVSHHQASQRSDQEIVMLIMVLVISTGLVVNTSLYLVEVIRINNLDTNLLNIGSYKYLITVSLTLKMMTLIMNTVLASKRAISKNRILAGGIGFTQYVVDIIAVSESTQVYCELPNEIRAQCVMFIITFSLLLIPIGIFTLIDFFASLCDKGTGLWLLTVYGTIIMSTGIAFFAKAINQNSHHVVIECTNCTHESPFIQNLNCSHGSDCFYDCLEFYR